MGDREMDAMGFVHLADLHLAPRSGSILKRDPATGRLVRDLDMDAAFEAAVDDVLSQPTLPSAVVIAGDVFDTYKGSADALITAITQIRRLRDAGVAVVGIAGNHDTPTNAMRTSAFEMLRSVFSVDPGVTLAYDSIEHVTVGDVEYVLLPHKACLREIEEAEVRPRRDAERAVLVVHGVAAGDPSLQQMDEAKEIPIAKWILDLGWDYVAFGHYHKPGWVPGYDGVAAYCGSLENTVVSGPDVCMSRGPVYVDLRRHDVELFDMHVLPVRPIVRLEPVDVAAMGEGVTPADIDDAIAAAVRDNPVRGAIVILPIRGITRPQFAALPHRDFSEFDRTALAVRRQVEFASEGREGVADDEGGREAEGEAALGPLPAEAEAMLDALVAAGEVPAERRDRVLAELLGLIGE